MFKIYVVQNGVGDHEIISLYYVWGQGQGMHYAMQGDLKRGITSLLDATVCEECRMEHLWIRDSLCFELNGIE